MKVYTLMGGWDYEGDNLLGVFASRNELLQFVEQEKAKHNRRPETLGYDTLGYVESELGQPIDFDAQVEWL